MVRELSPAVLRVAQAAQAAQAAKPDQGTLKLGHWFLGLLQEDEGRPAELLNRCRIPLDQTRARAESVLPQTAAAPPEEELYEAAQQHAIALRGGADITTDILLLVVLHADPALSGALAPLGLTVSRLEEALRSPHVTPATMEFDGATFTITDSQDQAQAARVLDANLNRAREALRVLDDYCRFVLNDAYLTEQFKKLRHSLAAASQRLPSGLLLAARDTTHDPGVHLAAGEEYHRPHPRGVAMVNAKRLQEALRSVEEFGKVFSSEFARNIEQLRYEAYILERPMLRDGGRRERLERARLYLLLTGSQCEAALDWTIEEAAAGGVDIVQMREKGLSDRELLDRARRMRDWTRQAEVLFIVNDRPDIAVLADADGVHVGQDDVDPVAARKLLGPDRLVGVSTHNLAQVRQAVRDAADYIGIGPVFPSSTKEFHDFPGLPFVQAATAETSLPAFALGGIHAGNLTQVRHAGGKRVAVSSAIARSNDPRATAQQLRWLLGESHEAGPNGVSGV